MAAIGARRRVLLVGNHRGQVQCPAAVTFSIAITISISMAVTVAFAFDFDRLRVFGNGQFRNGPVYFFLTSSRRPGIASSGCARLGAVTDSR